LFFSWGEKVKWDVVRGFRWILEVVRGVWVVADVELSGVYDLSGFSDTPILASGISDGVVKEPDKTSF
jgi:hypothetical protein